MTVHRPLELRGMLSHASSRVLATMICLASLSGCGAISNLVRNPSESSARSALEAVRQAKLDRLVHVTLVGGSKLNLSRAGLARPVQICVYLTYDEQWAPGPQSQGGKCLTTLQDLRIVSSESRFLAPDRVQQLSFKAPFDRDYWLVLDADFPEKPIGFAGLKLKVSGGDTSFHAVRFDGQQATDALAQR